MKNNLNQSLIDCFTCGGVGCPECSSTGKIPDRRKAQSSEIPVIEDRHFRAPLGDILMTWDRGVNLYETCTAIIELFSPYLKREIVEERPFKAEYDAEEKSMKIESAIEKITQAIKAANSNLSYEASRICARAVIKAINHIEDGNL